MAIMSIFGSSPRNLTGSEPAPQTWMSSERWRQLLPMTRRDRTITCYDYLGRLKTHGEEQRYISPTTGVCRKLVIQAIQPNGPNEHRIKDHTGHVNKRALWLLSTNPFSGFGVFFLWTLKWSIFTLGLLWYLIWVIIGAFAFLFLQIDLADAQIDIPGNWLDGDSEVYDTGYYKPYTRKFRGQLWEARSKKEYSTRLEGLDQDKKEDKIPTHSLHPRLLMIRDPARDEWSPCTEPSTIIRNKYIAISYRATDVYSESGSDQEREKDRFKQEVRIAAVRMNFDAYWLDLECIGKTQDEKNLSLYCMADIYRGAESTLIMLGNSEEGEKAAWERWGARVWTLPEALLSENIFYKFRDQSEINSVSLHKLANLAYPKNNSEQAVINAYSEKDPLERLERLSLLKSAVWKRGINNTSTPGGSGPHAAERVYALMGFFQHRIHPNHEEEELPALARLSMANDNDRIAERMVSLLPSEPHEKACWYADNDIYGAELWDILPETQIAGITEHGALVLDGCRAASIRWKDFPEIALVKPESMRRKVVGFLPYFAWPIFIVGVAALLIFSVKAGITLVTIGIVLLLVSPKMFVFSEAGRVINPQPWFIGVKGVLDIDTAAEHLYGGGNAAHYPRLNFTPSGSEFAEPEHGSVRGGSKKQYGEALKAEAKGRQIYTLIDTCAGAIYYFCAKRPPTVCLFTGREGGLGRFVLCSERCDGDASRLHKETVLRMPTELVARYINPLLI
ncbi:hypothetical protein J3R82DRAFT_6847 [Butyriboletus roseoflavus]|nr:hypothetical protein J3R82DRAFT_6847 [Butyriboletus roseoflavus]